MKILYLAMKEMSFRRLNFLLALLAMAGVVGVAVFWLAHIRCEQARTGQRVAQLDDEIRKITKAMGFNINILPADLNLQDFYANNFAEETMPFEYVTRLADSEFIKSVRHLRPALIRKVNWQEQNREIVLIGVSGVVPLTHVNNPKKPMSDPIESNTMNVGHLLATSYGLKKGSTVPFNGESFTVGKVYPPKGSVDDITAWIDLDRAQSMSSLSGRINMIQALECNCATPDRLAQIEKEISQVLGDDVQVIELSTTAIARAKARNQVSDSGKLALQQLQNQAQMWILSVGVVGTIVVGVFAWLNVRERRSEIGILRALGASTGKIIGLFVSRAVAIGIAAAIVGCFAGIVSAMSYERGQELRVDVRLLDDVWLFVSLVVITPLLTTIASWIPATLAAGQDAATVLSEEVT